MKSIKLICSLLAIFCYTANLAAQFQLSATMANGIDACAYLETEEAIVFFNGKAVQFYSTIAENEEAFSTEGIEDFPDWEVITAALPWGGDKLLLFQDQNYAVYAPWENAIVEFGTWEGLPSEWEGGLDAACQWAPDTYLFFYGNEVVAYNSDTDSYEEADVIANWEGWPSLWSTGIDSAVNIGAGMVFFFRGPAYVAYDMESGVFDQPMRTSGK